MKTRSTTKSSLNEQITAEKTIKARTSSSLSNTITKRIEKVSVSPICSLPSEMILEILACVSASSLNDLLRVKLSCKLFKKVAEEDYIYRKISLEERFVTDLYLKKEASAFFNRCLESGNPEAFYQKGVHEYFTDHMRKQSGLALLEKAVNASHLGASYVLGIIFICGSDEFEQRGLELVGKIKTSGQMQECRKKLEESASLIWKPHDIDFLKPKFFVCRFPDRKRSKWCFTSKDGDDLHCETCILNREIIHVCSILTGVPLHSYQYDMCLSSELKTS